jgi:putative endonuclease
MSLEKQRMGLRGEDIAAKWLRVHGWEIADRRFKNGHRDIDLIATRAQHQAGRTVAFVEVKTRAKDAFGGPVAQVNWRKQREIRRSAMVWMSRYQRPGDTFRFDVIGIIIGPQSVRVHHVENAFLLPANR